MTRAPLRAAHRRAAARKAAGALAAVLAASPAVRADAQGGATRTVLSLDAGAAIVAYDDFLRSTVASVTPSVRIENTRVMFLARGSYSRFESGNSSVQATLAGSIISPAVFNVRGELFATASTTRYAGAISATNVLTLGRLHLAGADGGAWVGSGFGVVALGNRFPNDLLQVDVGAWTRRGATTYTATITPTRIGRVRRINQTDSLDFRYADVTLAARWQGARGEVTSSLGYRAGPGSAIPGVDGWGEVWGTVWIAPRVALVGGTGVFPAELVQGLPGGRYASAGLRLASRRPAVSDPVLRAELTLPYELARLPDSRRRGARGAAKAFQIASNDDGSRTVRLRAPGARRVELMGDFTEWLPVPLARVGADEWAADVLVAPGVHRVNVRVDGGAWRVPPGLTAVRDEFGGEVGLLVVQ